MTYRKPLICKGLAGTMSALKSRAVKRPASVPAVLPKPSRPRPLNTAGRDASRFRTRGARTT
jgi:hypothetical protein